ncbi:hypothetical protein B0A55_11894 [Friedmanniomyces simplex]|uniref:Amidohydrolase-related domain-containing protein n=1 Tax=Friedmanniomyces simplex TaxID=329884 RepID=A0A4U0WDW9_9PEZI|nr:hypothetical protein B0A55_11894 [Friedmanniomyces simplex]
MIILKNGIALVHGADDHIEARRTDILISGSKISKLEADISGPADAEVIDCTDKIISPGFIDTHHHVWQTLLKGRHANQTLLQYLPEGNFTSSFYSAEDTFWGQLSGCLEMVECGTTSVSDFAHINYSPEHNDQVIAATASSGIRSIFCYCPTPLAKSWSPFTMEMNALGGHVLPTFDALAAQAPWADGRITLGFAFDAFHLLPKPYLDALMDRLKQHAIEVITFHYSHIPAQAPQSIAAKLNELGVLDERFLVAHGSNPTQEDAHLYCRLGVHVSSTPSTELQMGMGVPVVAFRDDLGKDLPENCSLGVDCHSATSAYIPYEARLGLQSARAVYGEKFLQQGKQPSSVKYTVEEAFNLATIRGARAAKMGDKTGSIVEGKCADLVIFSATSPCMLAAAQQDPVAAVILHSSPSDVETVIIDGVMRKKGGKLVNVAVDEKAKATAGRSSLKWDDVAQQVLRRRVTLGERIRGVDLKDAEQRMMDAWHIDKQAIVDHL